MAEGSQSVKIDETSSSGRQSAFRFKQKSSSSKHKRSHERASHDDKEPHSSSHSNGSKRSKRSRQEPLNDDPSLYDDTYIPNAASSKFKDPEEAFRESLFDAMADDEGANFWEGVYGQPIHVYSNERIGPQGELERMTDEEYTAYVRARMYEKTHQHEIEERQRRESARKKRREEEDIERARRRQHREQRDLDGSIEESLKRGQERRRKQQAEKIWKDYLAKWEKLLSTPVPEENAEPSIPWPTDDADMDSIDPEEVVRFFKNGAVLSSSGDTNDALMRILKVERVRWHPDKMQQRLGKQAMGDDVMASVTAIFQIIDRLWGETRQKATT